MHRRTVSCNVSIQLAGRAGCDSWLVGLAVRAQAGLVSDTGVWSAQGLVYVSDVLNSWPSSSSYSSPLSQAGLHTVHLADRSGCEGSALDSEAEVSDTGCLRRVQKGESMLAMFLTRDRQARTTVHSSGLSSWLTGLAAMALHWTQRSPTLDLCAECTRPSLELRQPHNMHTNSDRALPPAVPIAQSP